MLNQKITLRIVAFVFIYTVYVYLKPYQVKLVHIFMSVFEALQCNQKGRDMDVNRVICGAWFRGNVMMYCCTVCKCEGWTTPQHGLPKFSSCLHWQLTWVHNDDVTVVWSRLNAEHSDFINCWCLSVWIAENIHHVHMWSIFKTVTSHGISESFALKVKILWIFFFFYQKNQNSGFLWGLFLPT